MFLFCIEYLSSFPFYLFSDLRQPREVLWTYVCVRPLTSSLQAPALPGPKMKKNVARNSRNKTKNNFGQNWVCKKNLICSFLQTV